MAALFDAALQAHAGGSRQGSKLYGTAEADTAHMPSSAPLLPASLALQCLQHLAQHTQLDAACASACVSNLVGSTQAAQSHAALSATVCLLTAALCSGVNPQLPDSATATLRTAISHHAQLLLRQRCPTNGNVEAASAGAMISSSSSCGTVPAPAAVSATSAAGQRACSDAVDVQTSMLRLQAWACGRLLEDKGEPNDTATDVAKERQNHHYACSCMPSPCVRLYVNMLLQTTHSGLWIAVLQGLSCWRPPAPSSLHWPPVLWRPL
jgi:hypothetical protein